MKIKIVTVKNMLNNKKGFTLIELLVYMALLSIFMVVLTDILVTVLETQLSSQATSSVDSDSRFILARMAYDVSRASSINTPTNLGDTSASLSMTIGTTVYLYSVSSGNLQLTAGYSVNNLNSSDTTISNLSFQKIGNSGGKPTLLVNLSLGSMAKVGGLAQTRTFTTVFSTR